MTSGIRSTQAEDDKLKSMAIAGHSADEIAAVLHRSTSAVYGRLTEIWAFAAPDQTKATAVEIGLKEKGK